MGTKRILGKLICLAGTGLVMMSVLALFLGSILEISSKGFVLSAIGVLVLGAFLQATGEEVEHDK